METNIIIDKTYVQLFRISKISFKRVFVDKRVIFYEPQNDILVYINGIVIFNNLNAFLKFFIKVYSLGYE